MAKKICWAIFFMTIITNVIMLQWTIESYYGLEYEHVFRYTIIAIISTVIAVISFFYWRRLEYSK